ncbi:MAG TPA: carboxypeptidase-like regulatory domain-containing protein, partial [Candidatus Angelobacter sp.]|nr:carboxypeptidase-like regulatory domain-containing protein [Candidatus Angelobacter sp.]
MSRRRATCFVFFAFSFAVVAQQRPVTAANPRASEKTAQHAEFEISGTLVDSLTGQPINHARIAIAPVAQRDAFTTMVTGEDGQFKFGKVAPGKYTLTAQAHGHVTESFNQHDGYSSSVVVGPELNSTGLLFQLPPEGSISGTITDEAGEPVREAQVALYSTGIIGGLDRTALRGYARTDDQGFYRFGHLRKGKYLIGVSARPWYADHALVPPPPVITRTANGGTIGAVPGISFGAVGSVAPTAGDRPPEPQQSPLDVAYPITFYPGVTEAESAGLITLAAGDKATANVSLQPVPALHIRIADSAQGGYVTLQKPVLDAQPMQVLIETRGINGAIELVGVPPGHYSISTVRDFNPGQRRAGSPEGLSGEIDLAENGSVERHQGMQSASLTATVTAEGALTLEGALILTMKRGYGEVMEQKFSGSGDIELNHALSAG